MHRVGRKTVRHGKIHTDGCLYHSKKKCPTPISESSRADEPRCLKTNSEKGFKHVKTYCPSLETGATSHRGSSFCQSHWHIADARQQSVSWDVEGQDAYTAGENVKSEPSYRRKLCQHRCPPLSAGELPPKPPGAASNCGSHQPNLTRTMLLVLYTAT